MTLLEFAEILENTGFPVAYYQFPEEEVQSLPFICYVTTGTEQFMADGVVYYSALNVQVELYTEKKNPEAEYILEDALASFYYLKNEGFIDAEKMHLVTYNLSI